MSTKKNKIERVTPPSPERLEEILNEEVKPASFATLEEALPAILSKDETIAQLKAAVGELQEQNSLKDEFINELQETIKDKETILTETMATVEKLEKVKDSALEVVEDSEGNMYEVVVPIMNVAVDNVNNSVTTKKFVEANPKSKKDHMLFLDDKKVVDMCIAKDLGNLKKFNTK